MDTADGITVAAAEEKSEGSGARVLRAFPGSKISHVDPFVLMDEFFVDPSAGFPEHPHRGFEAVTYMLEGGFVHEDSAGNRATVRQGGLQRVTMGSGIKHSESPAEGQSHGIQLWINLPKELKDIEPEYEVVPREELSVEERGGVKTKTLISADAGPDLRTHVEYLYIELEEAEFRWEVKENYQGFIYVIEGEGVLEPGGEKCELSPGEVIVNDKKPLRELSVNPRTKLKFISLQGRPHGEPINMHGPYVD